MSALWAGGTTSVKRLRVKCRGLDPLAARLRLDNLLQTIELRPRCLAPSAIVCLRRLRDPFPGALSLQSRDAQPSRLWQEAVLTAIEELVRQAARPFSGEVSADAEAVIFRDRAELLACLALDWTRGRLGSVWWWQSLFGRADVTRLWTGACLNAPQYVPAAFELLNTRRSLNALARALSSTQARALLLEVTQSFALHELQSALEAGLPENNNRSSGVVTDAPEVQAVSPPDASPAETLRSHTSQSSIRREQPPAPWQQLLDLRLDHTLGVEQQCLLGVALMIRRAHARVCSPAFARSMLLWLRALSLHQQAADPQNPEELRRDTPTLREEDSTGEKRSGRQTLSSTKPAPSSESGAGTLIEDASLEATSATQHTARSFFQELSSDDADSQAHEAESAETIPDSLTREAGLLSAFQAAPVAQAGPTSFTPDRPAPDDPPLPNNSSSIPTSDEALFVGFQTQTLEEEDERQAVAALSEQRVETSFGGIFYLVNLALFLELYGDFTRPARAGLPLPIFDFVALLGARLLDQSMKDDPVWDVLARLAGRSELEPPGREFEPPQEWRLPSAWLDPFPESCTLEWTTLDERLYARHPAGFLLLDVALACNPAEQLKRELAVYGACDKLILKRASFVLPQGESALARWLDRLVPYVRARLGRAPGLSEAEDPARMLCVEPASLSASATHLDLFFSLAEHPLAIRLAGLDRNPGWVPAAARFITFHYE
ncbi:MAG TPA: hypothetical protein VGB17_18825 [Pyrinomonadaceae bacterium]|jgi:hypothetical protein